MERALRIYDITVPIREGMPIWPGDPRPTRRLVSSIGAGDACNVSALALGAHTGTHIDAPLHFIDGGAPVDRLPLDDLIGHAQVVEVAGDQHVTAADLENAGIHPDAVRVLLRTSNSRRARLRAGVFDPGFQAIGEDGARWLVERGIRLVGVDYLSVEPYSMEGATVHRMLLEARMVLLEGCDLVDVPAGDYGLVCAPMKWVGAEGAPARAVLVAGGPVWPGSCTEA